MRISRFLPVALALASMTAAAQSTYTWVSKSDLPLDSKGIWTLSPVASATRSPDGIVTTPGNDHSFMWFTSGVLPSTQLIQTSTTGTPPQLFLHDPTPGTWVTSGGGTRYLWTVGATAGTSAVYKLQNGVNVATAIMDCPLWVPGNQVALIETTPGTMNCWDLTANTHGTAWTDTASGGVLTDGVPGAVLANSGGVNAVMGAIKIAVR